MLWKTTFRFLLILSNLLGLACHAEESKVGDYASKAQAERRGLGLEQRLKVTREIFTGFSDAEILAELVAAVFERDKGGTPPFDMRGDIAESYADILRGDKELVSDDSYLRDAMRNEADPRKFFLLSRLSWGMRSNYDVNYIDESKHMLFQHGRIAKPLQAQMRMQPVWGDVSLYAYRTIVNDLKKSGSSFVPPDDSIPHGEKVLILDRWLTDNWNGRSDQSAGVGNLKRPGILPSEERKPSRVAGIEEVTETSRTQWPYYVAGVLFAISLLYLVKVRTSG